MLDLFLKTYSMNDIESSILRAFMLFIYRNLLLLPVP